MIPKLLGCALILVASFAASRLSVGQTKKRLALIEGWIGFLTLAKTEVEYNLTPLNDLLTKTDPSFLKLLDPKENRLESYLEASKKDLDRESYLILSSLVSSFGANFREELLLLCERCLASLSQKRREIAAELPTKKRQSLALSLSAAGLAILLLW